jgi:hypothetical protein
MIKNKRNFRKHSLDPQEWHLAIVMSSSARLTLKERKEAPAQKTTRQSLSN